MVSCKMENCYKFRISSSHVSSKPDSRWLKYKGQRSLNKPLRLHYPWQEWETKCLSRRSRRRKGSPGDESKCWWSHYGGLGGSSSTPSMLFCLDSQWVWRGCFGKYHPLRWSWAISRHFSANASTTWPFCIAMMLLLEHAVRVRVPEVCENTIT